MGLPIRGPVIHLTQSTCVRCWERGQTRLSETSLKAVAQVLEAARFAGEKHAHQRRKGAAAEPYVNHLIEVAGLVATALAQPDTNLVMAALLHDTIEDTGTTKEELVEHFGADVA